MLFLCYLVFSKLLITSMEHLALGLVGIPFAATSLWMMTKFSYLSFGVCVSDISCRISSLFLAVIVYLLLIIVLISEDLS